MRLRDINYMSAVNFSNMSWPRTDSEDFEMLVFGQKLLRRKENIVTSPYAGGRETKKNSLIDIALLQEIIITTNTTFLAPGWEIFALCADIQDGGSKQLP